MPQLFIKDIALVQQFFESMCKVGERFLKSLTWNALEKWNNKHLIVNFLCYVCQEEPDVRLAIQEALSMMVGAYANLQGALLTLMEALVAAYIGKVSAHSQSRIVY